MRHASSFTCISAVPPSTAAVSQLADPQDLHATDGCVLDASLGPGKCMQTAGPMHSQVKTSVVMKHGALMSIDGEHEALKLMPLPLQLLLALPLPSHKSYVSLQLASSEASMDLVTWGGSAWLHEATALLRLCVCSWE